jgi:hypothetical protein
LKSQKTLILAAAIVVLIFLVISAYTALPYLKIKDLQLEQGIYTNAIKITATNPTNSLIIFPETELEVYIDNIYYGKLNLNKTDIPAGQKIEIPGNFTVNQEGLNKFQQNQSIFAPSVVKYKGIATIEFLGIKNKLPFEFEKNLGSQAIKVG